MMGYILAKSSSIWKMLVDRRKMWLMLAIFGFALTIVRYNRLPGFDINYQEAPDLVKFLIHFVWRANTVLWLFAVIGFFRFLLKQKKQSANLY